VSGLNTISISSVKYSVVSSNSVTVEAIEFAGPHESRMRQYIINLVHQGQAIGPQSTQAEATTFKDLNIKIDHSQPSRPVFSIFSWLPRLVSHKTINPIANINYIEPPS
jgi:hypothetical protein